MRDVLLLTESDVHRLVDMPTAIRVVREAFVAQARGRARMPAKVYLNVPRGDFRAMPAYLEGSEACGLKWVNVHAGNRARGLPTVMAVMVMNDPATGAPIAIMDGRYLTKLRTAAAAAVAADALARKDVRTVGMVGCGAQADAQLRGLLQVRRRIRQARVWGQAPGEAVAFCRMMRRWLAGVELVPSATARECVTGADIVVTLTPSRRPVVKRAWIGPGVHVNAVGADAPGKQELDPRILKDARVVVDEREQATHGGEINVPVADGVFSVKAIAGSLGEVLTGSAVGRKTDRDITVFDSTGLAIHDVAVGQVAARRARARGVGKRIALFAA